MSDTFDQITSVYVRTRCKPSLSGSMHFGLLNLRCERSHPQTISFITCLVFNLDGIGMVRVVSIVLLFHFFSPVCLRAGSQREWTVDHIIVRSVNQTTSQSIVPSAFPSPNEPVNQLIYQSVSESKKHPVHQPFNQSINPLPTKITHQPINTPINHGQSVYQAINKPIIWSVSNLLL